jgi:SAM-dependent methyltransferase
VILDLGCGDGRVLIAAALARGCRGVGVDISEVGVTLPKVAGGAAPTGVTKYRVPSFPFQRCIGQAREIAAAEGVADRCVFEPLDLMAAEALPRLQSCGATLVFLYVYPTLLRRVVSLVKALALGGSRVVTLVYHFTDDEWAPEDVRCGGRFRLYSCSGAAEGGASSDAL